MSDREGGERAVPAGARSLEDRTAGPHAGLAPGEIETLRERAVRLAAAEEHSTDTGAVGAQMVSFRLMNEPFAVPLEDVVRVVRVRTVVAVPGSPAHVLGVISQRGRIVALIDLRTWWHGGVRGHADSDLAVIVTHGGLDLGIACSSVEGVADFRPDEIAEAPANLPARLAAAVRGVGRRETLLLSVADLLAQPGFLVDLPGEG